MDRLRCQQFRSRHDLPILVHGTVVQIQFHASGVFASALFSYFIVDCSVQHLLTLARARPLRIGSVRSGVFLTATIKFCGLGNHDLVRVDHMCVHQRTVWKEDLLVAQNQLTPITAHGQCFCRRPGRNDYCCPKASSFPGWHRRLVSQRLRSWFPGSRESRPNRSAVLQ